MLNTTLSRGPCLTCLRLCTRGPTRSSSLLSFMQPSEASAAQSGSSASRNKRRSRKRPSAAPPASALPPGFESLHLQDSRNPHNTSPNGSKQARLQQSRSQGFATAAAVSAESALSQEAPSQNARTSSTTRAHLTDVRFDELPISVLTKRALAEVLRYDLCTDVQAQSVPASLQGPDMVCKAKTGTGKTLAFLIPALEKVSGRAAGKISALIISPTRELAYQIAVEAEALGRFHNLTVQCVVGGTNIDSEIRKMKNNPPHILVATPGRLIDHLQNHNASTYMTSLNTFVLDEADRLLDMGFRPDVEKILRALPSKDTRQTLLFSATFPEDIQQLAQFALRPGFTLVDTVGEDSTHSSSQVQQSAMVVPMERISAQLVHTLQQHRASDPDHKVLVFFTTARLTQMYAEMCNNAGISVLEIHSRKSQAHRTRVAGRFRDGTGLTMFTSDVSARGVDYPDVTLVMQVGMPADQAQYIHRVGRTARAGKIGQAILLLHDFEQSFLNKIAELPVEVVEATPPQELAEAEGRVRQGLARLSSAAKGGGYQAWLGFYKTHAKVLRWNLDQLVHQANMFSQTIGCDEPPELNKKTVGMMGLKGVPGLRLAPSAAGGGRGAGAPSWSSAGRGSAKSSGRGPGSGGRGPGGGGRGQSSGGRGHGSDGRGGGQQGGDTLSW